MHLNALNLVRRVWICIRMLWIWLRFFIQRVLIYIGMLWIPFEWLEFVFECFESFQMVTICIWMLRISLLYHGSTSLYIILPWLYLTLLDYTSLFHGSNWLYLTLHESTIALRDTTWLYVTLPWLYHGSTWLYITLPWLYLTILDSALLYHGSTWIYLALNFSTIWMLGVLFEWFQFASEWL